MPRRAPRIDDWASTTSSLGSAKDKHAGILFQQREPLPPRMIDALIRQHPIAARIVGLIVETAFSVDWKITKVAGPDADKFDAAAIKAELDAAGLTTAERQSAEWARQYGGAITTIAVLNSGEPKQPMAIGPASRLLRFAAVPAERARPLEQDVGLMSPTYGMALAYQVTGIASASVDLHHTRAIPHEPIKLPIEAQYEAPSPTGWGPSVLDRHFDDLGRYGATAAHGVSMMYGASLLYLRLSGYKQEAQTKAGMDRIQKRADATRRALDAYGLAVMDKDDELGTVTQGLTGAAELADKSESRLVAGTEYPREILFNESPTGLRGGELSGPQEIYHKRVESWRKQEIDPGLRRGVEIAIRLHGLAIDSFEIEWDPLWTRSAEGDAEIHSKNATADAAYVDKGVLTADEIREARFVRGDVGMIKIAGEANADPLELDPADVAAGVAAGATPSPPAEVATPADQAMNGAQIASLIDIMRAVNMRELTYPQGIGALGVAFPNLRGREASVLGPPPVPGGPAPAGAPAPSLDELPGDRVTVQAAAQRFGIKTRTITRMIERGLPFWGFGSHRVVSLAAVEAMAKAHEEIVEPEDPNDPTDQEPEPDAPGGGGVVP
jgi:phage-related protein (TIGR01555 family)